MTAERRATLRAAAPIAGGVLLAILALALHPHARGQTGAAAELHELALLSLRDRLVHGTLLLLLGTLLAELVNYALRRGFTRRPVVVGLVGFSVGIGGLIVAGLIDGFLLPDLVARFLDAEPAVQRAALTTLAACGIAVNVFATFGVVALTCAIVAWSLDLARDGGESRVAANVGFGAAALTSAMLATGGRDPSPHALIVMLGAQGVWYGWIFVLLARQSAEGVGRRPGLGGATALAEID